MPKVISLDNRFYVILGKQLVHVGPTNIPWKKPHKTLKQINEEGEEIKKYRKKTSMKEK